MSPYKFVQMFINLYLKFLHKYCKYKMIVNGMHYVYYLRPVTKVDSSGARRMKLLGNANVFLIEIY